MKKTYNILGTALVRGAIVHLHVVVLPGLSLALALSSGEALGSLSRHLEQLVLKLRWSERVECLICQKVEDLQSLREPRL